MTSGVSRRELLKGLTVIGMAGMAGLLEACQTKTPEPTATSPAKPAATPTPEAKNVTVHGMTLPADAAPYDQQIFRYWSGYEPPHLDRSAGLDAGADLPFLVQEPLTKLNEDAELVGCVAESWSVSSDGLTWTFNIRKGLQWSDGQPFNAQDVYFTIQRWADPDLKFGYNWFFGEIQNMVPIWMGEKPMSELGVKLVDDYTVQVMVSAPTPFLPDKLLMIPMAPKHVLKETSTPIDWATKPETLVAGGPYVLKSWEKGKRFIFEANPNYTGAFTPSFKTIIAYATGAQIPMYEAGELDVAMADRPTVERAKADPETWGLHRYTDWQSHFVVLNNHKAPWDNLKLRQALSLAFDREALCRLLGEEFAEPAFSMLSEGFPGYNAELKSIQTYDPAKAKQLLAEAGYPDGQGWEKQELLLPYAATHPFLEGMVKQWKDNLNIDVELAPIDSGIFHSDQGRGKGQFSAYWGQFQFDYLDPHNMLEIFRSNRIWDWNDPKYDALIDTGQSFLGDPKERIKIYMEAEQYMVEQAGVIFLWHNRTNFLLRPYVKGKGASPNSFGIVPWRGNKLSTAIYNMYITQDREPISI